MLFTFCLFGFLLALSPSYVPQILVSLNGPASTIYVKIQPFWNRLLWGSKMATKEKASTGSVAIAKTPADLQRMRLEKLMAAPVSGFFSM